MLQPTRSHFLNTFKSAPRRPSIIPSRSYTGTASPPDGANRTKNFGVSVFSEFTPLAVRHMAVNLGQGFPDFPRTHFSRHSLSIPNKKCVSFKPEQIAEFVYKIMTICSVL
jgi:hypothetical protein